MHIITNYLLQYTLVMSTVSRDKKHLRRALLFCFDLKKSAAESHRMLVKAYGNDALSVRSCSWWFQRFKAGNFDVNDKEPENRPKKFENVELQALLDENNAQTQEELADQLGVTAASISRRLRAMRMVQISGKWVPHESTEGQQENSSTTLKRKREEENV